MAVATGIRDVEVDRFAMYLFFSVHSQIYALLFCFEIQCFAIRYSAVRNYSSFQHRAVSWLIYGCLVLHLRLLPSSAVFVVANNRRAMIVWAMVLSCVSVCSIRCQRGRVVRSNFSSSQLDFTPSTAAVSLPIVMGHRVVIYIYVLSVLQSVRSRSCAQNS